jgi:two-component system sensor histidine kinase/response regulator
MPSDVTDKLGAPSRVLAPNNGTDSASKAPPYPHAAPLPAAALPDPSITGDTTRRSKIIGNAAAAAATPNTPFILLVDDEPKNLQVAGALLRSAGFDIGLVSSGPDALSLIDSEQPDLILLDVMMPHMDGYEVCQKLKSNPVTAGIPVIFLTARNEEEDILQGFSAGGEDYLTKPFRPRELLARVRTHVRLRQTEEELRRAYQELREVNANQNRFFSILAHDLRRPFTGFRAFSHILEADDGSITIEDVLAVCRDFKAEADRSQQLLENLLAWANTQMGRVNFNPQRVNLAEAVELALESSLPQALLKKQEVHLDIPAGAVVRADAEMVLTILRNLIANSVKFTPRQGRIVISAEPDPNNREFVAIWVEDTGIGMTDAQIDALFRVEKVRPTEGTDRELGTGLGLILSQGFVERHGGTIRVESRPSQGTRITFTLPRGW